MSKIRITESDIKKMVSAVIKEVFDNTDKVADQMFYDDSDSMATIKTVLERGGWE